MTLSDVTSVMLDEVNATAGRFASRRRVLRRAASRAGLSTRSTVHPSALSPTQPEHVAVLHPARGVEFSAPARDLRLVPGGQRRAVGRSAIGAGGCEESP